MMTGPDWAFTLPPGYELVRIGYRREAPPSIFMRSDAGALVVYRPKPGSRRD